MKPIFPGGGLHIHIRLLPAAQPWFVHHITYQVIRLKVLGYQLKTFLSNYFFIISQYS